MKIIFIVFGFLGINCGIRQQSWPLQQQHVVCIYNDTVIYDGTPRTFYKYSDEKWYIETNDGPDLILPGNCEIK